MTTASEIQAAQDAAIRVAREHDQGVMANAKSALDRMKADIGIIAAAAPDIISPYVGVHLTALKTDHDRAVAAITNALHEVTMALEASANG